MGLVKEIKNLRPELHVDLLACFEDLVGRKIDIVITGLVHHKLCAAFSLRDPNLQWRDAFRQQRANDDE